MQSGVVMPCGAVVVNVEEAYKAGVNARANLDLNEYLSMLDEFFVRTKPESELQKIKQAAQAVIERWNSPNWASADGFVHTGELIRNLEKALNEGKA